LEPSIAPPAPTPNPTTEYERAGVDAADTALTLVAAIIIAVSIFILLNVLRLSWIYCCRPMSDDELLAKENKARQQKLRGLEEAQEANQKDFALKKASAMKQVPSQTVSTIEFQQSKVNDLYGGFEAKGTKSTKGASSSYPQPPPPPPPPSRLPPGPWSQHDVLTRSIWSADTSLSREETKEEEEEVATPSSVVFSNPGVTIEVDEEPEESFKEWIQAKRNINEYARDEALLQQSGAAGSIPRGPVLIDDSIGTFRELLGNTRVGNEGVIEVARAPRASRTRRSSELESSSATSNHASVYDARKATNDRVVPASLHGSVDAALGWTGDLLSTVPIPDMGVSLTNESFAPSNLTSSSRQGSPFHRTNDDSSGIIGDSLSSIGSIFGSTSARSDSQGKFRGPGTGI
jgi:hypothetical protein